MNDCKHQIYFLSPSTIPNMSIVKCQNCNANLSFYPINEPSDGIKILQKETKMIKKDLLQIKQALETIFEEMQKIKKPYNHT